MIKRARGFIGCTMAASDRQPAPSRDKHHAVARNADWIADIHRFVDDANCRHAPDIHVAADRQKNLFIRYHKSSCLEEYKSPLANQRAFFVLNRPPDWPLQVLRHRPV